MTETSIDLWKRVRSGDDNAREELILYYLFLVKAVVRSIARKAPWAQLEDLMQEGVRGLAKAIERFDPQKEEEFEAYASFWIRGVIFESDELARGIKKSQFKKYRKVKQSHDRLMEELDRKPTIEEIASDTGFKAQAVIEALEVISVAFRIFATEDDESKDSNSPVMQTFFNGVGSAFTRAQVRSAVLKLDKRDSQIIEWHHQHGYTDTEIAEKLGEPGKGGKIKKIRQRAEKKLRDLL